MDTIERVAWMFGGILAVWPQAHASTITSMPITIRRDALLQVVKFQERSIRTRRDAVELVDKIREDAKTKPDRRVLPK